MTEPTLSQRITEYEERAKESHVGRQHQGYRDCIPCDATRILAAVGMRSDAAEALENMISYDCTCADPDAEYSCPVYSAVAALDSAKKRLDKAER